MVKKWKIYYKQVHHTLHHESRIFLWNYFEQIHIRLSSQCLKKILNFIYLEWSKKKNVNNLITEPFHHERNIFCPWNYLEQVLSTFFTMFFKLSIVDSFLIGELPLLCIETPCKICNKYLKSGSKGFWFWFLFQLLKPKSNFSSLLSCLCD